MGLFPTDANDLDEVTNANGTTFQYNAADDKWIIITNVDVYSQDEVDALLAALDKYTQAEVDAKLTLYGCEVFPIKHHTSDEYNNMIRLDANGETAGGSFKIHDNIDPSEDIDITFLVYGLNADAAVTCARYVGVYATDKTEAHSYNNVVNAGAANIDTDPINIVSKWTYTLAAASFAADDAVSMWIKLNEASRTIYLVMGYYEYTKLKA